MVVACKTKGTGFKALANYLEKGSEAAPKPGRIEWIEARNIATPDPATAARIMRATANHNDRVAAGGAKPVEHLSISWEPGDKPSKDQMIMVADRVLKAVGLDRNQALIIAHNDTDHSHVHLFVNPVDPDSFKVAPDKHDYWIIEEVLRKAEREFGWRETPGHHWRFPDQERPSKERTPSKAERREIEEGKRPFAALVRDAARQDFKEAKTWSDLEQRLAAKGLRLEPVGKVGLVVTDGKERCKASDIDRSAGRKSLEGRLGSYEQRHDTAVIQGSHQRDGHGRGRGGPGSDLEQAGRRQRGLDQDGPRPGGDGPQPGADRRPDAGGRPAPDHRYGDPGPGVGDSGGSSERLRDESSRLHARPMERQPPSLTDSIAALQRYDTQAIATKEAETELREIKAQLARIDGKDRWAAKELEATLRQLAKVYRAPERAYARIQDEIARHGAGKVTARLERHPEAFGRLRGWRLAGGILTKQPWTIFASAERRAALRQITDLGREIRKQAGIDRAVKAAAVSRPALEQRANFLGATIDTIRQHQGERLRWDYVRDIERAAKLAAKSERKALSPEAAKVLDKIEADQRARFAKLNQDRAQARRAEATKQSPQTRERQAPGQAKSRDHSPEQER
jgi:hypothetical protein